MSIDLWSRTAADAERDTDSTADVTSPRGRRRRWLAPAGLVVAVVAVALLFVTTGPAPTSTAALDPQNPTASGAQALARVLDEQGVRVDIVRGQAELARAGVDADTTVLVARTSELSPTTSRELAQLTRGAERLVLVSPPRPVLRELSPATGVTQVRRSAADLVAAQCAGGDIRTGETLSRSDSEFQAPGAVASCFTHGFSSVYVALPRTGQTAPLVLLGSTTALANDQVAADANAAVLLRTLGHSGRLVWYVPSRLDSPASATGTASVVPRWIVPGLGLGAVAVLALMFWRGRRLGRLVPEPLPVVVRAAETTESRGRLYRRARDASRAGLVLQSASRRRLADVMGMPRPTASGAPDHALVAAVAAASGRRIDEVGALLYGPPPSQDDHLLGLAAELADLEKEVRRV